MRILFNPPFIFTIMETIYDIIGIGIGPFNLGLAALAHTNTSLNCLFIDQNSSFNWHQGMMLKGTKLQVPFHADLVTLADPRNQYSFLSYLQTKRRLFRFTIREEYFPLRTEYNDYCRWVTEQLPMLLFNHRCLEITYDKEQQYYMITCEHLAAHTFPTFKCKHLVLGIGTTPYYPPFTGRDLKGVLHSEHYLSHKSELLDSQRITLIGSGQSAAEIFDDLLAAGKKPYWFTRSARFFPMDYSKFALEMTSPDYIRHFYQLDPTVKEQVLLQQSMLYKGINQELITAIYDKLYENALYQDQDEQKFLFPNAALQDVHEVEGWLNCQFEQRETGRSFNHKTMHLILATGYRNTTPAFLHALKDKIQWDNKGRFAVAANYHIDREATFFVQNAEMHTHGYNTPDLGLGPYRNAIILNTILGREQFFIESNVPFQGFSGPA